MRTTQQSICDARTNLQVSKLAQALTFCSKTIAPKLLHFKDMTKGRI